MSVDPGKLDVRFSISEGSEECAAIADDTRVLEHTYDMKAGHAYYIVVYAENQAMESNLVSTNCVTNNQGTFLTFLNPLHTVIDITVFLLSFPHDQLEVSRKYFFKYFNNSEALTQEFPSNFE